MRQFKLLVIDDDEIGNLYLGVLLSSLSIIKEYHIESSGWDSLDYLDLNKTKFPDLIMVDLNMPEMDGFDFITKYEESFFEDFPKTKIMVMSNSVLEVDRKKSLHFKSVCEYINKPVTVEIITKTLGSHDTLI